MTPWGGDKGRSWSTPWSGKNTPWSRGMNTRDMPWGRRGFSSRSMPWGGRDSDFPFFGDNKFTDKFFDKFDEFDDDDDGMREFLDDMWDETINAPYEMGEMPGGARAPSFAVPGPAEIADEFQSGTRNFFEDKARSKSSFDDRPRPRPKPTPAPKPDLEPGPQK
ncbi:MAG: hypothetical protein ABFR19_02970 [Pseudomonadota bacterium]